MLIFVIKKCFHTNIYTQSNLAETYDIVFFHIFRGALKPKKRNLHGGQLTSYSHLKYIKSESRHVAVMACQ